MADAERLAKLREDLEKACKAQKFSKILKKANEVLNIDGEDADAKRCKAVALAKLDRCKEGAISASRGAAVPSRHRRDSCPSHNEVGGFFFDFEAIRTESSDRDAPRRSGMLRRRRSFTGREGLLPVSAR
jgi:hypothetical protein